MSTIRITDNGFEIINVRPNLETSIWSKLKDKTKRVLQKRGILAKRESTNDPKLRK